MIWDAGERVEEVEREVRMWVTEKPGDGKIYEELKAGERKLDN